MAYDEKAIEELLARATANLCIDASPETVKRVEERLRAVAAELALEWLAGERRHETIGQQTEHWLSRLYDTIYKDEQPDGSRIYARFGLPLPRAQYVTRLLIARRTAHWRQVARVEVARELKKLEQRARAALEKGNQTSKFELPLSRGAFDELMLLYDRALLGADGSTFSPPARQSSSPSRVFVGLTAETLCAILAIVPKPEES